MRTSSFISMVSFWLSAFTLTQAQRGDGGECCQSTDCISGLCFTDKTSTTGGRCHGSGNKGDVCLVTQAGSCTAPSNCVVPSKNAAEGNCS